MSVSEIHALIQLLDDPDEGVYRHVREELLSKGTGILPAVLEHRADKSHCAVHESRLNELVDGLHGGYVKNGLQDWFKEGAQNIIEGALWIHKASDPLIDIDVVKAQYEKLKGDVWLELNEDCSWYDVKLDYVGVGSVLAVSLCELNPYKLCHCISCVTV